MKKTIKIIFILVVALSIISITYIEIRAKELMNIDYIEPSFSLIDKQNEISKDIQDSITYSPQVYLDPYNIAPLSALITFKTENKTSVKVIIKGDKNSPDLVNSFDEANEHILPIFGLYADSNNKVIVQYDDKEIEFSIKTDPLPDDFLEATRTSINSDYANILGSDFYFLTPASKGYTSAYDINGNVRWYLTDNLVWEVRYLNNGNLVLSNEKMLNPPYYTTGLYELSLSGKIIKEYIIPGGYHHDVTEHSNGNLIVLSDDFKNETVEDFIVEIDRNSGEVVKEIDLKEILEVDSGKSENWIDFDWFHNNSGWYDEATNSLTLSGRHQDIVVNIDYDTLEINYILGDSEGFSEDFKKHFLKPDANTEFSYAQHAAKILPNGNMFVFDNGVNRSKNFSEYLAANDNYSRGVIYDIDKENMSVSQVYQYGKERGKEFFSSYVSDVDYLNDNHYLIHSGGIAFNNDDVLNSPPGITEYTSLKSITSEIYNDELIFELEMPNNFYRAEKMPVYNSSKHESLENGISLGKLDVSPYDKKTLSLFKKVNYDSSIFDTYSLEIVEEGNRLSISGNFDKKDKVKVVLYSKLEALEYNIRISDRPYTAMCIVVFDNEKQNVNYFINKNGMPDKDYVVLIDINGVLYSTNVKVNLGK